MKKLPPKGLIVSCYLESMKGCEREFIASVAHLPQVVALRVEGLDNIRFARMIAPEQYIIGLVKKRVGWETYITEQSWQSIEIGQAGADMVATSCFEVWLSHLDRDPVYGGFWLFRPVMVDLDTSNLCRLDTIDPLKKRAFQRDIEQGNIVLATTLEQRGYSLMAHIHAKYPQARVNLEGGIETPEQVKRGFEEGAAYVTIGKAINDPPTIIRRLVCG